METDAFFFQLFKRLPQTVFDLLGLDRRQSDRYRFDSVELKKSFRIDGLFLPNADELPVIFVEVQFQQLAKFYANLMAKVLCYLEENNPRQEWLAVAIFPDRKAEPKDVGSLDYMLQDKRIHRVYLDEIPVIDDPPFGLGILHLVSAPVEATKRMVEALVHKAEREQTDREVGRQVIQLVEELLLRRFIDFNREEIRNMFELHDIRKSRVWQEAHEKGEKKGEKKGKEEGRLEVKREMVRNCLKRNMSIKEIAALMEITLKEVRDLAK